MSMVEEANPRHLDLLKTPVRKLRDVFCQSARHILLVVGHLPYDSQSDWRSLFLTISVFDFD